jgi:hypothetical protein
MQHVPKPTAATAGGQQSQQRDKTPKLKAVAASVVVLLAVGWAAVTHSSSSSSILWPSFAATGSKSNSSSSSTPFSGVPLLAIQQQQQQQNPEQAAQLHANLQLQRLQLSEAVTPAAVQRLLQGARLPKRVTTRMAQQLIVEAQLLQHSLQDGHAAARVNAIRRHYDTISSSSSSSSSSRKDSEALQSAEAAASTAEAPQRALQEQQLPISEPAARIASTSTSSGSSSSSGSRGILIVGGSRTHLGNAYILLRMLRQHLRCQLPIEIVYYGQQELDPAAAALVRSFIAAEETAGKARITLIDGLKVQGQHIGTLQPHPTDTKLTSWVAKVHALCWVTSFQQVLLLDSDNLPVQDPEVLFEVPEFNNNGFLIWPDFWHNLWMEPAVYRLLNLSVPWEVNPKGFLAAESGQMLLDRSAHADVLEWLWLLNSHRELVYECVVGDKDTYRMAFELAGKDQQYTQVCVRHGVSMHMVNVFADASDSRECGSKGSSSRSCSSRSNISSDGKQHCLAAQAGNSKADHSCVDHACIRYVCATRTMYWWLLFLQVSQPPQELLADAGADVTMNCFLNVGICPPLACFCRCCSHPGSSWVMLVLKSTRIVCFT